MRSYHVIQREICPHCHGAGFTINPNWDAYFVALRANPETRLDDWVIEHGMRSIHGMGRMELFCEPCQGKGYTETTVTLLAALDDLASRRSIDGAAGGVLD